jgi:hypothetical protein
MYKYLLGMLLIGSNVMASETFYDKSESFDLCKCQEGSDAYNTWIANQYNQSDEVRLRANSTEIKKRKEEQVVAQNALIKLVVDLGIQTNQNDQDEQDVDSNANNKDKPKFTIPAPPKKKYASTHTKDKEGLHCCALL